VNVNPVIWKCWYFSSSFTVSASKESDVDGKPETHVGHMWFERKANSKNWIQVQVSPFAKRNEARCWFFGRNTAHDIDQLICHWSIQHNVKTKVEFEASKTKVVRLFVLNCGSFLLGEYGNIQFIAFVMKGSRKHFVLEAMQTYLVVKAYIRL